MKHCMLAKFIPEVTGDEKDKMITEVFDLFKTLENIDGIHAVVCRRNCVARDNRYDIFIEIDMDAAALPVYDESTPHKTWKAEYGKYVASKAIFDYTE